MEVYVSSRKVLTNGILLLFGHIQFSSRAIANTHTFTERSQFTVVLLFLPDIQEWLAVLEFQVVVFGQARVTISNEIRGQTW